MKKIITILFIVLVAARVFAQAPSKMNYQAVVRGAAGDLVTGTALGMRITILQGSATGTPVYVETQSPMTNANGLATVEIGNGAAVTGVFSAINWSNGPYFIKTETDPLGGTNYTISGTSQLMSVPFAFYAETSGTPGPQGIQGNDGAQGPQGPQGPAGNDGATVSVNSIQHVGGNITITKSDIGLANVDNTSDVIKPVSAPVQTALNLKANINSPVFTGVPTVPTATTGANTTQIATTAFVTDAVTTSTTPDASASTKGRVALGGDLAGTGTTAEAPVITENAITTVKIADGNVTTAKIGTASVTTIKIADGSVNTVKIADESITTDKIADASVTTVKIYNESVTNPKIADASITTAKIDDASVTTDKIVDAGITTAKLDNESVTTTKIAESGVTTSKIADASITTDKIVDGNITTDKIADANVTTDKIADANITGVKIADSNIANNHIADAAVTYAKVQDVNTGKVLGRTTAGTGVVEELSTTGTGDVVMSESPAFTGQPTVPTPSPGSNSNQVATTEFVKSQITAGEMKATPSGIGMMLSDGDAGKIVTTQWAGWPVFPEDLSNGFSCTIVNYSNSPFTSNTISTAVFFTTNSGWNNGNGLTSFSIKSGGTVRVSVIDVNGVKGYFISGDIQ